MEETPSKQAGVVMEVPARSFPEPVLTAEQWDECKRAVKAGMELKEAAELFGVEYEAVKKRSLRGEWLTKTRIIAKAEEIRAKEAERVANLSRSVPSGRPRVETAIEAHAESYEGHRSGTLLAIAKTLKNGLSAETVQNMVPKDVSEFVQMGNLALKLYAVGQEGVQVNVLVGGDGGFDGPVVETEAECVEDETEFDS